MNSATRHEIRQLLGEIGERLAEIDKLIPAEPLPFVYYVQAFEVAILKTFEQHPDRSLSEREVKILSNAYNKPGGLAAFKMAWKNVLDLLVQVGVNRKGKGLYKAEPVQAEGAK